MTARSRIPRAIVAALLAVALSWAAGLSAGAHLVDALDRTAACAGGHVAGPRHGECAPVARSRPSSFVMKPLRRPVSSLATARDVPSIQAAPDQVVDEPASVGARRLSLPREARAPPVVVS